MYIEEHSFYSRQNALNNLNSLLHSAENSKKKREEILQRISTLQKNYNNLERALNKYTKILALCESGLNAYRDERLECLKKQIQDNLNLVFPGDDFRVKFVPSFFRNHETIDFYTGRGNQLSPMQMQNGRLFRQVCSFSISSMIQILQGCELLIMDEAINSGDPESTKIVSTLIETLVDSGYQIILIEHKEELYSNLNRRQYNLHRNPHLNVIDSIERVDINE